MVNKTEHIRIMNLKKEMYKPLPEDKCSLDLGKYLGAAINMRFITKE